MSATRFGAERLLDRIGLELRGRTFPKSGAGLLRDVPEDETT